MEKGIRSTAETNPADRTKVIGTIETLVDDDTELGAEAYKIWESNPKLEPKQAVVQAKEQLRKDSE